MNQTASLEKTNQQQVDIQMVIFGTVTGTLFVLFILVVFISLDRRQREEKFRKWISDEANKRISLDSQFYERKITSPV